MKLSGLIESWLEVRDQLIQEKLKPVQDENKIAHLEEQVHFWAKSIDKYIDDVAEHYALYYKD